MRQGEFALMDQNILKVEVGSEIPRKCMVTGDSSCELRIVPDIVRSDNK